MRVHYDAAISSVQCCLNLLFYSISVGRVGTLGMGTCVRVRLRNVLLRGPKILVNGDAPEADVEHRVDDDDADFANFVGPLRLPEHVRFAAVFIATAALLLVVWCRRRRVTHRIGLYRTGSHINDLVPNARQHRPTTRFKMGNQGLLWLRK